MKAATDTRNQSSHPTGSIDTSSQSHHQEGTWYEIRVKGHLGEEWSDWFEGLTLRPVENGEMVLSGRIVDQAALIGVLSKLNRLNLALLSVQSPGE